MRDHPYVSVRFSVKEDTLEDLDSMRAVRLRYTAAGSSTPHFAPALTPALSGLYLDIPAERS